MEKQNIFTIDSLLERQNIRVLHENINQLFQGLYHQAIEDSHGLSRKKNLEYPEVEIRQIWKDLLEKMVQNEWITLPSGEGVALELLALEYELLSNPVWPMPHGRDILEYLGKGNYKLGIVSNAQFYTSLTLEALLGATLGALHFREDLLSWSYVLGQAKPSTELFKAPLEALKAQGIPSSQVLYIGNDMLNDIYTARQWGCKTALFAGDLRSLRLRENHPLCRGISPDLILTDFTQLKECLYG